MGNRYKRIFGLKPFMKAVSLLLVVTLLAGCIPQSVYAAGQKDAEGQTAKTACQETTYKGKGYEVKAEITSVWGNYANVEITVLNKSLHRMEDWELASCADFTWSNIWDALLVNEESGMPDGDAASVSNNTVSDGAGHFIIKGNDWNKDIGLWGKAVFGGTVCCEDGEVSLPKIFTVTDKKSRTDSKEQNATETADVMAAAEDTEPQEQSGSVEDDAEAQGSENGQLIGNGISSEEDATTGRLPYELPSELEGLNYALFAGTPSGMAVCSNEMKIVGDVHSNGGFTYSGNKLCVTGALNAAGTITASVSGAEDALKLGSRNEKQPKLPVPDITELIDKKFRETAGKEPEENIQLEGEDFQGNGIILAKQNIIYNVANIQPQGESPLLFCAENGNITLNGSSFELNATLYAPKGCVTINASDVTLNGRIIADSVCLNGTFLKLRAGEHDFDVIKDQLVPEPEPEEEIKAELSVSGNLKQNRRVVMSLLGENNGALSDNVQAEWTIQKVGNEDVQADEDIFTDECGIRAQKGCLAADKENSDAFHKELLFMEAGTYTVEVLLKEGDREKLLTEEVVIETDRAPEAGFTFAETLCERDTDGNAQLQMTDTSVSPDGDEITGRKWEIIYDKNNDGIFDEKEDLISDGKEKEISYPTNRVGNYKVILTVTEGFTDTIPALLPEDAYRQDDTTDRDESACTARVVNHAPEAYFEIEKQRKADIVFTIGDAEKADVDYCNEQVKELQKKLEAQGVDTRISTVETATMTAEDSFLWKEYDHYKPVSRGDPDHHIDRDGDSIRITGYTVVPYRDFLFIPDENEDAKVLKFDLQRDNQNWHTIEGGGFLFNTEIDEEKDMINGFCALLYSKGIKIMQIDHLSLSEFRNGKGKQPICIATADIGDVFEKKNLTVRVNPKAFPYGMEKKAVISDFVLPECTSYGYGPILCNASHGCYQLSYFDFDRIKLTTVTGESMEDTMLNYDWREGAKRYIIHLSDMEPGSLATDELLADTSKAVIDNEITLVGLGNKESERGFKKLINTTGKGMFISVNSLQQDVQTVEDYIFNDVINTSVKPGRFLSTSDLLNYKVHYKDKENDPLYKSEWSYETDSNLFKQKAEPEITTEVREEPIAQFENTGAYSVRLRVQDNPDRTVSDNSVELTDETDTVSDNSLTISGNEIPEETQEENIFGEWSETYEYPDTVLVQTRPETSLSTQVYQDRLDRKKCGVIIEASGRDKDHEGEEDRGIISESFSYKEVNDAEWTEGIPKESLPIDGAYLVKYQVQDKEKSYSYPEVAVIKARELKEFEPAADKTPPEVSLSVSAAQISLGQSVEIAAYAKDENPFSVFEVKCGAQILGKTQGQYTYTPKQAGNYMVYASAVDIAGNRKTASFRLRVVDKDITPPVIEVDEAIQEPDNPQKIRVTGSVTDDKQLKEYTISCRQKDDAYTDLYTGTEAVVKGEIGAIDTGEWQDGRYEIKITATDETGNSSNYSFFFTKSTQTIHEEKRIWLDGARLNREKEQIEICGTLVYNPETETVSGNCIRKDDETPVPMQMTYDTQDEVLAVIPTKDLQTGQYEAGFAVTAEDGEWVADSCEFTYTKGSTGNEGGESGGTEGGEGETTTDDVLTQPEQPPVEDVEPSLEMELSRQTAQIGEDVIIRVNRTGSISENSLRVTVSGNEIPMEDGKGKFTSDVPMQQTVRAQAQTTAGELLTAEQLCTFIDPSDKTAPKVSFKDYELTEDNAFVIKEPTDITGSISDDKKLLNYKLEYRLRGEKDYSLLAEGNEEKDGEVLGTLDTTLLQNGLYEVRLSATDAGGNKSNTTRVYSVEGGLKVGELAVGFTDLTAKLPFGSMNINRMYDSRQKSEGDFGYGWSLGLAGMTIQKTKPLDEGYEQTVSGKGLSTRYQVSETLRHDVVVYYGDGTSDRFGVALSPAVRKWYPIEDVEVGFICKTNPKLKLKLAGDNSALVGKEGLVWLGNSAPDTYVLTTEDGREVWLSEKRGFLRSVDAFGNTMNYSKNGFVDHNGKGVVFERDYLGRISKLTDDYGHELNYVYDDEGNLSRFIDTAGNEVTYTYDDNHRLIQIIDAAGIAVARYEYDENGRIAAVIDAQGNRIEYTHNLDERTEVVADRCGNKTIYQYDADGNVISETDPEGHTKKSTYDASGNVLTETDALGNTKSYQYDDKNNVTQVTDADGNVSNSVYNAKNQITSIKNMDGTELLCDYNDKELLTSTKDTQENETAYEYDGNGNVTGITDELGKVAVYTYDKDGNVAASTDGEGNVTTYKYDKSGNCTQSLQTKKTNTGSGKTTVTTIYTYNESGKLTQTNTGGRVTKATYDESGNIATSTDADGKVTTYTHTPTGEVDTITYYDKTTEHFTYDANGNVLTQTDRLGKTSTNTYDKAGNLLATTDALGNVTKYEYDAAYRLTGVTAPTGAVTRYSYDKLGRNTKIETEEGTVEYTYDAYGNILSMKDALGNVMEYAYDTLGRRTEIRLPDGAKIKTSYDSRGNILSQTDAEGNVTKYEYDNNDSLKSITDAEGNTTHYVYNGAGELLQTTDAKGNKTEYQYNLNGETVREIRADGKQKGWGYETGGSIRSITNFDGKVINYTYRDKKLLVVTAGTKQSRYTYDALSRVETISDKDGTIRYTYDEYGRITGRMTAAGEEIKYGYDCYGRTTDLTTGAGTVHYDYDKFNRLTAVTDTDGTKTTYAYDKNGNKKTQTNPDGTAISYTYDSCNRLTGETVTDKDGKTIAEYTYTFNGNGQKTETKETYTRNGQTYKTETAYEYDKAGRLTKETVKTEEATDITSYTYDAVGNRIKKMENGVLTEYTYNELNQLTEEKCGDSTIAYAYDVNGNLLCKGNETEYDTYTYDAWNRLATATNHTPAGEKTETYVYDAEGNRLKKTESHKQADTAETDGGTVADTVGTDATETAADTTATEVTDKVTWYVMDNLMGYSQTVLELDENKKLKASYTRGDSLTAQYHYNTDGRAEKHTYITDGHGDVRMLLDKEGRITDTYCYSAYGELKERTGTTDNPYLYTGEAYDEGTGLYYLRVRYMNPETGTFISMDSYRGNSYDPASLHRYTYAQNDPQKYNDPSGHFVGLVGACVSNISSEILRNSYAIHTMGMINGMMNTILNQVLPTGDDPGTAFLKGYLAGAGFAAAYVGACVLGVVYELMVAVHALMFACFSVSSICMLAVALDYAAVGNHKAALFYTVLAVLSMAGAFSILSATATMRVIGPKGTLKIKVIDEGNSASKWWHEGYVDDLSDTQMILGVKKSDKGLSTLGSATREEAISAGKAWVGENYNAIQDNAGNVLGYSSADGMRAFRIQYKSKEGMWRANFQENIMVNNPYPNIGQHSSQLKNVHIDISN